MKKISTILLILVQSLVINAKVYKVYGSQGGLDMTITLPHGFNTEKDTCDMVILMHGIFSSKDITPMPAISRQLAKAGIASIRFNFGGHWSSEGKISNMTIEREIQDAIAIWNYACSLPYINKIGLLGHSQGGVVASMTAGRLVNSNTKKQPYGLALLAPASVLKNACNKGHLLGAHFDPTNPPEYIKCFGIMKVSKDYILSTQKLDIYGTAEIYNGPVRIIHGSEDRLVPLWCSEDYKKLYNDKAELVIVDKENHRMSKKTRNIAYIVTDFFEKKRK